MPAKAIWPSDSWPAQPVRIVSDMPQMAKTRIVVYSRCRDGWVTMSGSTTAPSSRARPGRPGRGRRTHQMVGSRSGIGRRFGREGERLRLALGPWRLWKYTATRMAMRMRKSIEPGLVEEVEADDGLRRRRWRCPAKNARWNDTMPAITAAASARTSVLGPRVARLGGRAGLGRRSARSTAWPARPAIAHTNGRHQLRADAVQPGEVGVLGRRLDALAEGRAVEEPAEARARRSGTTTRIGSCGAGDADRRRSRALPPMRLREPAPQARRCRGRR